MKANKKSRKNLPNYASKIQSLDKDQLTKLDGMASSPDPGINRLAKAVASIVQGCSIRKAAAENHFNHWNLCKLLKRVAEEGVDFIEAPRKKGRPFKVQEDDAKKVLGIHSLPPSSFGLSIPRWTHRDLRDFLVKHGRIKGLSVQTVGNILRKKRRKKKGRADKKESVPVKHVPKLTQTELPLPVSGAEYPGLRRIVEKIKSLMPIWMGFWGSKGISEDGFEAEIQEKPMEALTRVYLAIPFDVTDENTLGPHFYDIPEAFEELLRQAYLETKLDAISRNEKPDVLDALSKAFLFAKKETAKVCRRTAIQWDPKVGELESGILNFLRRYYSHPLFSKFGLPAIAYFFKRCHGREKRKVESVRRNLLNVLSTPISVVSDFMDYLPEDIFQERGLEEADLYCAVEKCVELHGYEYKTLKKKRHEVKNFYEATRGFKILWKDMGRESRERKERELQIAEMEREKDDIDYAMRREIQELENGDDDTISLFDSRQEKFKLEDMMKMSAWKHYRLSDARALTAERIVHFAGFLETWRTEKVKVHHQVALISAYWFSLLTGVPVTVALGKLQGRVTSLRLFRHLSIDPLGPPLEPQSIFEKIAPIYGLKEVSHVFEGKPSLCEMMRWAVEAYSKKFKFAGIHLMQIGYTGQAGLVEDMDLVDASHVCGRFLFGAVSHMQYIQPHALRKKFVNHCIKRLDGWTNDAEAMKLEKHSATYRECLKLGVSQIQKLIGCNLSVREQYEVQFFGFIESKTVDKTLERLIKEGFQDDVVRKILVLNAIAHYYLERFALLRPQESRSVRFRSLNSMLGVLVIDGKGNRLIQEEIRVVPIPNHLNEFLTKWKHLVVRLAKNNDDGPSMLMTPYWKGRPTKMLLDCLRTEHIDCDNSYPLRKYSATLLYREGVPCLYRKTLMGQSVLGMEFFNRASFEDFQVLRDSMGKLQVPERLHRQVMELLDATVRELPGELFHVRNALGTFEERRDPEKSNLKYYAGMLHKALTDPLPEAIAEKSGIVEECIVSNIYANEQKEEKKLKGEDFEWDEDASGSLDMIWKAMARGSYVDENGEQGNPIPYQRLLDMKNKLLRYLYVLYGNVPVKNPPKLPIMVDRDLVVDMKKLLELPPDCASQIINYARLHSRSLPAQGKGEILSKKGPSVQEIASFRLAEELAFLGLSMNMIKSLECRDFIVEHHLLRVPEYSTYRYIALPQQVWPLLIACIKKMGRYNEVRRRYRASIFPQGDKFIEKLGRMVQARFRAARNGLGLNRKVEVTLDHIRENGLLFHLAAGLPPSTINHFYSPSPPANVMEIIGRKRKKSHKNVDFLKIAPISSFVKDDKPRDEGLSANWSKMRFQIFQIHKITDKIENKTAFLNGGRNEISILLKSWKDEMDETIYPEYRMLPDWIEFQLKKGNDASSVVSCLDHLSAFLGRLSDEGILLKEEEVDDWENLMISLYSSGGIAPKEKTVLNLESNVGRYLRFLRAKGFKVPIIKWRKIRKKADRSPRLLAIPSSDDIVHAMDKIVGQTGSEWDQISETCVAAGLSTLCGLRTIDLVGLMVWNVRCREKGGYLEIHHSKGDKYRRVPLDRLLEHAGLERLFKERLGAANSVDVHYFYKLTSDESFRNCVKKYFDSLKIKEFRILRHRFAMDVLLRIMKDPPMGMTVTDKVVDLLNAMGHTYGLTLERYNQSHVETARMREDWSKVLPSWIRGEERDHYLSAREASAMFLKTRAGSKWNCWNVAPYPSAKRGCGPSPKLWIRPEDLISTNTCI